MSILINMTQQDGDGFVPTSALVVDSTAITDGAIVNADINAAAAIAYSKLAALTTGSILLGVANVATVTDMKTSGQIPVGNGTTLASVAVSGDSSLSAAGVMTNTGMTIGTVNVTAAANAVTSNTNAGVITSSTANLGAATSETIVLTNSKITANSRVFVSVTGPGTGGTVAVLSATPSAGSLSIIVKNMDGGNAMTSVYKLSFFVVN